MVNGVLVETSLVVALEKVVSAPRLLRYRDAASSDMETVVLYCWNIQLAEALLPTISMLEVTVRNATHNALTNTMGTDLWFDRVLNGKSLENINSLIAEITRRQGSTPSSGKVISEITLGFWPKLYGRRHQSLWWDVNNPLLPVVLPHFGKIGRDTRKAFETRLEYAAKLRNRCMHHEAVFQGVAPLNRPVIPIDVLHRHLIETIGWMSDDAAGIASCMDRFDDVYQGGKQDAEQRLRKHFGL